MSEQKNTKIVEELQPNSWKHYFRIGMTVFLTVAACITFFFMLYRWSDISKVINTIFTSAQPITIGLVLTYLLMPVKNFVERPVYTWLLTTKYKKKQAKS